MRLIDYDAAIGRYYAEYEKQDICDGAEDRDFLKRCFDEATTVDAAPVVHGRWVDAHHSTSSCKCAICGAVYANKTTYCPKCGAKMDLPEKEIIQ